MTKASRSIENQMRLEIRQIGIPPRPAILAEIDRELAQDDPDFAELARAISSDVGLSATLIKTTNSPYFGFQKRIRSVHEALLVLGLKLIVQTIAGLSLRKIFEHVPDMERFWDASSMTARMSGWLAGRLRKQCGVRPEDAYTFGLFRDCGIPVLMIPFPEYRDILRKANDDRKGNFTAIEDQCLSINHADVGAELARSWLLPEELVLAIQHHHDVASSGMTGAPIVPPVSWRMVALANLAEHLIQQSTGLALGHEWEKAVDATLVQLGLSIKELAELETLSVLVVVDE